MAILSIILLYFIKRHTLLSWRLGMLFSVLQIIVIMTMSGNMQVFPYILALVTGLESTLYWRPNMFFTINEVSNERRLSFQSIRQIITEVMKIGMPILLGLLITDSGYLHAALIILVISVAQLLLSIMFRPTHHKAVSMHRGDVVFRKVVKHQGLRRILYLQFFRGALVSGSAFLIIPRLLVYGYTESDFSLGLYASIAAVVAIALIIIFRRVAHSRQHIRTFLSIIAAIAIAITMALLIMPNVFTAIILYVFSLAFIEGFFNMYIGSRVQHKLRKYLPDDSYIIEIESASEVYLCAGRILSLGILLAVTSYIGNGALPLFVVINILLIFPTIFLVRPKPKDEKGPIPKVYSEQ